MRIILIAYDFLPCVSPQSLRWYYLSRELALLGHQVCVVTPRVGMIEEPGLPALPSGVELLRTFPGPFGAVLHLRARMRRRTLAQASAGSDQARFAGPAEVEQLNWKGRLARRLYSLTGRAFLAFRGLADCILFPDIRTEWEPWARSGLRRQVRHWRPDVVVASHEPATDVRLGLYAESLGCPLVVDLGDPVLAVYTPRRWRGVAGRLQRRMCKRADHICVTSELVKGSLIESFGAQPNQVSVITQGFDDRIAHGQPEPFPEERSVGLEREASLELLYTGSFYPFRSPENVIRAVEEVEGVRLRVATVRPPDALVAAAARLPQKFEILGFVGHVETLALQRRAHVLVNIANANPAQIPGKFYEYLGSGRPVLHIVQGPNDVAAQLVRSRGLGWCCENDADSIASTLRWLVDRLRTAGPDGMFSGARGSVAEFGWSALAIRLEAVLREVAMRNRSLDAAGIP